MSEREAAMSRAATLIDLGRYQDAIELLGEVVATEPGNAAALSSLSFAYLSALEPQRAVEFAQRAVYAAPDSAQALNILAWSSMQLPDLDAAAAAADSLLRLEPQSLRALAASARVATMMWRSLLDSPLPDPEAMQQRRDQADTMVARLHELYPNDVATHVADGYRLVNIYGDNENGVEAFRRALLIDPNNAETIRMLGDASLRPMDGLKYARMALAQDPDNKLALNAAALVAGTAMHNIVMFQIPASLVGGLLVLLGAGTFGRVVFLILAILGGLISAIYFGANAGFSKAQRLIYRRVHPSRWYAWWGAVAGIVLLDIFFFGVTAPPLAVTALAWSMIVVGVAIALAVFGPGFVARRKVKAALNASGSKPS